MKGKLLGETKFYQFQTEFRNAIVREEFENGIETAEVVEVEGKDSKSVKVQATVLEFKHNFFTKVFSSLIDINGTHFHSPTLVDKTLRNFNKQLNIVRIGKIYSYYTFSDWLICLVMEKIHSTAIVIKEGKEFNFNAFIGFSLLYLQENSGTAKSRMLMKRFIENNPTKVLKLLDIVGIDNIYSYIHMIGITRFSNKFLIKALPQINIQEHKKRIIKHLLKRKCDLL